MQLPSSLVTVTPLSKRIALFLFFLLPIGAFILGMKYQSAIQQINTPIPTLPPDQGVACTMDAMICPDGTAVGRVPPRCEFQACPTSANAIPTGAPCGGIAGRMCPVNYVCEVDRSYPDAAGTCVRVTQIEPSETSTSSPPSAGQGM